MSDEQDHRLSNLINGLIVRTRAENGGLRWEEGGNDTFEISLTRTTIRVGSEDGDGRSPYFFEILDENGRSVEKVSTRDRQFDIERLYELASRSYRGVDAKLTEIMGELGIEDTPYAPPDPDPWGSPPQSRSANDDEPPF